MNLAVFDLDGTLLETNAVDDRCFAEAWLDETGIDCADVDWSTFEHVTDTGIAEELLARAGGPASHDILGRVERRFVELLMREAERAPAAFRPLPGAAAMMEQLPQAGWEVAIATGSWGASAAAKLSAAGNLFASVPLAASDGLRSREEIVLYAIALAGSTSGCRIVLFGDASWDVETARRLALPFVGVGSGERRERLRAFGVEHVLEDFLDVGLVLRALADAKPLA